MCLSLCTICLRTGGRENQLSTGRDICQQEPAERKSSTVLHMYSVFLCLSIAERVEERETVIIFCGSPLVQLLMDVVQSLIKSITTESFCPKVAPFTRKTGSCQWEI